ncbi:GntR family transcriptional regulator [Roseomonas chloroacetimidivorans]|jgi:GntR family transcriptional regulator|uniref:GntR family transcriptional regulator n=1 Tax=Roseomonas chloroacetimidivorans TaxID=1766656 RepID=UPI003C759EDB
MNFEPSLWRSIHAALEASLAAGEYPPGTPLPSEAKLAARFGVAIGTVRRAVDELVASRTLIRKQGRGTFVPDHGPDRTLFHFFHIVGEDDHREHPATELLSFQSGQPCPEWAAARLGIEPGSMMLRVQNLQRLQGRPVMLDELWLPEALFPGLDQASFAKRTGTIYGLYQQRYGYSVVRADERLRAAAAPEEVAALLSVEAGMPMLRIQRVAFAIGDRPLELRQSWVDTRDHVYFSRLS